MLSQLYSVFSNHTLIERELSTLIASGVVRKLLLRGSSADGRGGEVTGMGGEFGLVLQETYSSLISPHSLELHAFAKWHEDAGHLVVSISHANLVAQGITADEIKKAVELGFLTIEYSLREAGYTISVPGSGNFIRNLRGGRRELLRYLKRQKYKETLEKVRTLRLVFISLPFCSAHFILCLRMLIKESYSEEVEGEFTVIWISFT